jgi:protein tyrosine/serine phosphatase
MAEFRAGHMSWPDRYLEMAQHGGDAFRGLFEALADEEAGPLLFHCSGGKDRTGVATALLLAALGVADEDIAHDFGRTRSELEQHRPRFEQLWTKLRLDSEQISELLAAEPATMLAFLELVRKAYGSIPGYLASIGVPLDQQDRIRRRLVERSLE